MHANMAYQLYYTRVQTPCACMEPHKPYPHELTPHSMIHSDNEKGGGLAKGIAIAALSAASAINCMLATHTLANILRRRVFTPDPK